MLQVGLDRLKASSCTSNYRQTEFRVIQVSFIAEQLAVRVLLLFVIFVTFSISILNPVQFLS